MGAQGAVSPFRNSLQDTLNYVKISAGGQKISSWTRNKSCGLEISPVDLLAV